MDSTAEPERRVIIRWNENGQERGISLRYMSEYRDFGTHVAVWMFGSTEPRILRDEPADAFRKEVRHA